MSAFTPLIAAVLPFILWPLELFLPYPAVIEELAKAVTLFVFNRNARPFRPYQSSLAFGCMFALSESVLYLFNIISVGTISTFVLRLALTIPLHSATALILSLNIFKGWKRALMGIIGAMLLHFLFNSLVGFYSGASAF